jgi:hypothetical protein
VVLQRINGGYVMNKLAPGGRTIAAALAERVSDIANRQATCCTQRRSAPRRVNNITRGESQRKTKGSGFDSRGIISPNQPGPTERLFVA